MTRTKRHQLTFRHAFQLEAVAYLLPAGDYIVITDEELIEGLSFPVYRRVSSWIVAPVRDRGGTTEMLTVDPRDLAAAHARDGASAATAAEKT